MSQISMDQPAQPQMAQVPNDLTLAHKVAHSGASMSHVVPASKDTKQSTVSSTELPVLPKPTLQIDGSIALEILLDAIGDEVRQSEVKAGVAEVKANAAHQEEVTKKRLKMLEGQITKLKNSGIWELICNIFKYIAIALVGVFCLAMLASGVGSGVGVAALVLLGVSFANQVLEPVGKAVTGRRGFDLTSLIGWGIAAGTGNSKAAQVVKSILDVVLRIATTLCTSGAGFTGVAETFTKAAETINAIADSLKKGGNTVLDGMQNFLSLLGNIVSKTSYASKAGSESNSSKTAPAASVDTSEDKRMEEKRLDQKHLEAILENMQMVNDSISKHLKKIIEESKESAGKVNSIIKENATTHAAILSGGGGAAMA